MAWSTCKLTLAAMTLFVATLVALTCATAQDYPNRPITLVIPLPPGGTNSIMARAVADKLSELLGQQVVVENRPSGGSGTVGTRQVARSTPDGYTLLLGYTSNLATAPSIYPNIGYDPRKDFAPIGLIASASGLLLVHPSLPVDNVSDLIALMKKSAEPLSNRATGHRHGQSSGVGAVRPAGRRQDAANPVQGLARADHRSGRRSRQGRVQPDPGVPRRHRRRLDPRARRHGPEKVHPPAACADAIRIGPAGL